MSMPELGSLQEHQIQQQPSQSAPPSLGATAMVGLHSRSAPVLGAEWDHLPSAVHAELATRLPVRDLVAMQQTVREVSYSEEAHRLRGHTEAMREQVNAVADLLSFDTAIDSLASPQGAGRLSDQHRSAMLVQLLNQLKNQLSQGQPSYVADFDRRRLAIRHAIDALDPRYQDEAAAAYADLLSMDIHNANLEARAVEVLLSELDDLLRHLQPQCRSRTLEVAMKININHVNAFQRISTLTRWVGMVEGEPNVDIRMRLLREGLVQWRNLSYVLIRLGSVGEDFGRSLIRQAIGDAEHRRGAALVGDVTCIHTAVHFHRGFTDILDENMSAWLRLIDRLPRTSTDIRETMLLEVLQRATEGGRSMRMSDWAQAVRMWVALPLAALRRQRFADAQAWTQGLRSPQRQVVHDVGLQALAQAAQNHQLSRVVVLAPMLSELIANEPDVDARQTRWEALVHAMNIPPLQGLAAAERLGIVHSMIHSALMYASSDGAQHEASSSANPPSRYRLTRPMAVVVSQVLIQALEERPGDLRGQDLRMLARRIWEMPNPAASWIREALRAALPQLMSGQPQAEIAAVDELLRSGH